MERFYPKEVRNIVSMDDEGLGIFSCPYLEGGAHLHVPGTKEQFLLVGAKLCELHGDLYVHGDVRLANMLFPVNGRDAFLVDFDFCRPCGDAANPPLYIEGYATDALPRHPDARGKEPMSQMHDVFSFWLCFLRVCGKDVTSMPLPARTMKGLISIIRDSDMRLADVDPADIPELNIRTSPTGDRGTDLSDVTVESGP